MTRQELEDRIAACEQRIIELDGALWDEDISVDVFHELSEELAAERRRLERLEAKALDEEP